VAPETSIYFRGQREYVLLFQGIETVHMIRKGQVRWLPKGAFVEQVRFVESLFGLQVAV
jgi:hypothetical protein